MSVLTLSCLTANLPGERAARLSGTCQISELSDIHTSWSSNFTVYIILWCGPTMSVFYFTHCCRPSTWPFSSDRNNHVVTPNLTYMCLLGQICYSGDLRCANMYFQIWMLPTRLHVTSLTNINDINVYKHFVKCILDLSVSCHAKHRWTVLCATVKGPLSVFADNYDLCLGYFRYVHRI